MTERKSFWGQFDDLMTVLEKRKATTISLPKTRHSSSTSEIWQNGKHISIKTVNGKTTIKVNGKEYVPKDKK